MTNVECYFTSVLKELYAGMLVGYIYLVSYKNQHLEMLVYDIRQFQVSPLFPNSAVIYDVEIDFKPQAKVAHSLNLIFGRW